MDGFSLESGIPSSEDSAEYEDSLEFLESLFHLLWRYGASLWYSADSSEVDEDPLDEDEDDEDDDSLWD
jgi:hypothetical protein